MLYNISHSAIKVYLAGICQLHIRQSKQMPELSSMLWLNQVPRGIKIWQSKSGTLRQQPCLPITPEVLLRIKSTWEPEGISTDRITLWAAFTTCFLGSRDQVKSARRWMSLSAEQETSHHRPWKLINYKTLRHLESAWDIPKWILSAKGWIFSSRKRMMSFAQSQFSWPG